MIETILITLLGVVATVYAAVLIRTVLWTRSLTSLQPARSRLPRIAVIVAARNEEQNLPACLDALLTQNYPRDRIDVFVANDHSTDRTTEVIDTYVEKTRAGNSSISIHRVDVPEPTSHLQGKAQAIHTAIKACDHEYILITDADCRPPDQWAKMHAAYAADDDIGMVCGHAYVSGSSVFASVQALDWTFLLMIASMLAEENHPLTAMGNNMGIKRETYEATGGYPSLPFSVTEDYVLFKTVAERTPYRIRYPADPALCVHTLPETSFPALYGQRRRWAWGGLDAPLWARCLYVIGFLVHLLPLLCLAVAPLFAAAVLLLKLLLDGSLLHASLKLGSRTRHLSAFAAFEGYLFFYTITLPFVLLLFRRIRWKDRRF